MSQPPVTVRVPAKVNLQLSVGAKGRDGFHPLSTVFQAVSLYDEVTAQEAAPGSGISVSVRGEDIADVPLDGRNLAVRAASALAGRLGVRPDVRLHIGKGIPVAGGMAGGSADAAAALVACNALWGGGASPQDLAEVAAGLGSDVPFMLMGGTAIGSGRGERLQPVAASGRYQWVFATAYQGLSTPAVYQRFDELARGARVRVPEPVLDERVLAALRSGDPAALGSALRNDLQAAAISLQPSLQAVLDAGLAAGALGAVVSGSGPTIALLVADDDAALAVAMALAPSRLCKSLRRAFGPVAGASRLQS